MQLLRVPGGELDALSLLLGVWLVIAAADLSAPFLEPSEARAFFDRMLDYFQRERDLRECV